MTVSPALHKVPSTGLPKYDWACARGMAATARTMSAYADAEEPLSIFMTLKLFLLQAVVGPGG
ncbi:hypothetical protein ACU16_10085 [Xanthomonas oryzae pv. oryzicola]|nr:hypothetical protein ACU16_10085 [Xanthomonas oryzae pv. oryzicola]AKO08329.1 hypothetical protein ACU17_09940 [Xanthomonas oryzae pv. oryzicola]